MPRVHTVKKARKDQPDYGIKKGETYYYWTFKVGARGSRKVVSKTYPKQSQLTQSEYLSACYSAQESVEAVEVTADCFDDLISVLESAKSDIESAGEECQGKYENLPENFQNSATGERLQNRSESCQTLADAIDTAISELTDLRDTQGDDVGEEEDEESDNVVDKIQAILDDISWEFGD